MALLAIIKNILRRVTIACSDLLVEPLLYIGKKDTLDGAKAEAMLANIHADSNGSCICSREISEEKDYDVHVIVPVYNTERYVRECLDSAFFHNTKYSVFVSVVNDGSTDSCAKILEEYESRFNGEILTQENAGLSAARNKALEHIRGRYVMFLDSADVLPDGAIDALVDLADKTDADIVDGNYRTFNDINRKNVILIPRDQEQAEECSGFACVKIFRAEMFRNVQFPVGYIYEDTIVCGILRQMAKRIARTSAIVYSYRQNSNGICAAAKPDNRAIDTYWVTKRVLMDHKTLGLPIDSKLYDIMLDNAKKQHAVMKTLKDKTACKQAFVAMADFYNRYFEGIETSCNNKKRISKAIKKGNYLAYRWHCLIGG
ncbi:MAG: glycosyltransferase family 2 protein [Bacteroidales bacterium]|nr:glycosyltransferase family 2 protein [Bacteroidales bacterium]